MPPILSNKGITPQELEKYDNKLMKKGVVDLTQQESHEISEAVNMKPKNSYTAKLKKASKKNLEKLVDADTLHLKHHPSPDDEMELQEDKTKLKLLKYIDTKWFNSDNLKDRKIKLLKNRVIKRINSGEFLHKKEVNKYIKDYYAKQ